MRKIHFLLLLHVIWTQTTFCQLAKPAVKVVAISSGSSIKLRWAPNHAGAWHMANKFGYTIERTLLTEDNRLVTPRRVTLNASPILPAPEKIWSVYMDDDDYVAVAAQAILGSSFSLEAGSSLSGLVAKATELDSRFSFTLFAADQSVRAAELSALYYQDETVSAGGKYLYRIYCNIPKEILQVDTGFVFIGLGDKVPPPRIKDLQIESTNSNVVLSWDGKASGYYSGFLVERSVDGAKTFRRITEKPLVNTSKVDHSVGRIYKSDSLLDANTRHIYRVRGISAFGDMGPYSDTISAKAVPARVPTPTVRTYEVSPDGTIELFWDFPTARLADLKCFEVLEYLPDRKVRSIRNVSPDTTRATIPPGSSPYIIVAAVGKDGRRAKSFPFLINIPDTIPPTTPVGLNGKISPTGKVLVTWDENGEEDLLGYSVYRSNSETDFVMVSREISSLNEFLDSVSLHTLHEKIYYKVAAIDRHFNHSSLSNLLQLEKPDLIPPSSPVIKEVWSDSIGIHLRWLPGDSKDIIRQVLYTRAEDDSEWVQRKMFDPATSQWSDLQDGNRGARQYRLTAIDDSGLESTPSASVTGFTAGRPNGISDSFSTVDPKEKLIGIFWDCVDGEVGAFMLYKSLNGKPLRLYHSIPGSARNFIDRYAAQHKRIEYRLAVRDKNGAMSYLSKPIIVEP
jgi:uncharacterized protein